MLAGDPTRVVPLDGLDVVDEHCLYLCCPFLGELKLCLSVGMGSSCRTVKHITPNSASLNKPSAAKQIQVVSRIISCVVSTPDMWVIDTSRSFITHISDSTYCFLQFHITPALDTALLVNELLSTCASYV